MTAPAVSMRVRARANQEQRRAARTGEIAARHERWVAGEPLMQALHVRMATIHRQVQRQHLAAAAIHATHADRLRSWVDMPEGPRTPQRLAAPGGDPSVGDRLPGYRKSGQPQLRQRRRLARSRSRRREPRPLVRVTAPSRILPVTSGRAHTLLMALVDTLGDSFENWESLSTFAARCGAMLDVTAAALLLADQRGMLSLAVCSGEPAKSFTDAELARGEGPGVECHRTGRYGAYPTTAALAVRWPQLASNARRAGIEAAFAVPLRRRDQAIGVLILFDHRPGHLSDDAVRLARLLAAAATVGLINQRAVEQYERTAAQLQTALTSRIVIEQAKGVLAERLGIPLDAAFDLLRGQARANNRNLHEVAAEVVGRGIHVTARDQTFDPGKPPNTKPSR